MRSEIQCSKSIERGSLDTGMSDRDGTKLHYGQCTIQCFFELGLFLVLKVNMSQSLTPRFQSFFSARKYGCMHLVFNAGKSFSGRQQICPCLFLCMGHYHDRKMTNYVWRRISEEVGLPCVELVLCNSLFQDIRHHSACTLYVTQLACFQCLVSMPLNFSLRENV